MKLGPTLALGVAGSGLAAVAGSKSWWHFGAQTASDATSLTQRPEVSAIALVSLATWGVVLVTRGGLRRAAVLLGVLAAASTVAVSVHGLITKPALNDVFSYTGTKVTADLSSAGWFAVVGALVGLVAAIVARVSVRSWPEMGAKYDAPSSPATTLHASTKTAPETPLDWWRSLDEGNDPTG